MESEVWKYGMEIMKMLDFFIYMINQSTVTHFPFY